MRILVLLAIMATRAATEAMLPGSDQLVSPPPVGALVLPPLPSPVLGKRARLTAAKASKAASKASMEAERVAHAEATRAAAPAMDALRDPLRAAQAVQRGGIRPYQRPIEAVARAEKTAAQAKARKLLRSIQNAARAKARRDKRDPTVTPAATLFQHYSAGVTPILEDAERLACMKVGDAGYAELVLQVEETIQRHMHVSEDDEFARSACFATADSSAAHTIHVCGTCGLRDPSAAYDTSGSLDDLPPEKQWMRCRPEPLAALDLQPVIPLLRRAPDGTHEVVPIRRRNLINLYEHNGRAYHILPEAVLHGPINTDGTPGECTVQLCAHCLKPPKPPSAEAAGPPAPPLDGGGAADSRLGDVGAEGVSGVPSVGPFASPSADASPSAVTSDDCYSSLYNSEAPPNSIAAGSDYGRLATLEELVIETRPSTLERLVLATSRVHFVVLKVVAFGDVTDRKRLSGHLVCFSHARVDTPEASDFGAEAIRSSLDGVRVLFIGPKGQRTSLEKSALLVDDVRLRALVIYNSLALGCALHGGAAPPAVEVVQTLLDENSVAEHIRATARHTLDDSVERAIAPSDINSVRARAATVAARAEARALDASEAPLDPSDMLPPNMAAAGVFKAPNQSMDTLLTSVSETLVPGADETGGGVLGVSGGSVGGAAGALLDGGDPSSLPATNLPAALPARPDLSLFVDPFDDGVLPPPPLPPPPPPPPPAWKQQRFGILNDYDAGPETLYSAFWTLFPLRRGLVLGKAVP
ncbi:hypothetical protein T492DRAFT_885745 [Pavlovales sp. CCMP2436]|nr:hypothetical protein T492DRAFT_885745 [Pavlovales sp. CCMP2436]